MDKPAGDGGPANGAEADTNESKIAVVAALCGNAALSVLKGISAAATGSAAMLAETLHSIADTSAGGRRSRSPAASGDADPWRASALDQATRRGRSCRR